MKGEKGVGWSWGYFSFSKKRKYRIVESFFLFLKEKYRFGKVILCLKEKVQIWDFLFLKEEVQI